MKLSSRKTQTPGAVRSASFSRRLLVRDSPIESSTFKGLPIPTTASRQQFSEDVEGAFALWFWLKEGQLNVMAFAAHNFFSFHNHFLNRSFG